MNTEKMNTDAKQIGDAIDAAMQAFDGGRGIKQAALSRMSGVPQPTISRTLKGKSIPETETLSKLVAVLGGEKLGKTIQAILGSEAKRVQPTIEPLTIAMFALHCGACGKVSHKSFIELELNDTIDCSCGSKIVVADYYGQSELETILKSFGGVGFSLRKRTKSS